MHHDGAHNEVERALWNDELRTRAWPRREPLTAMVSAPLFEHLALTPGERVLDVGCGGGTTTLEAARRVGEGGLALGADISVGLIELAQGRARDQGVDVARFVVADVQQDALPDAPFDVAMSQFGVMFFDDPVAAFARIRGHVASGGRLGFASWLGSDRNPWHVGPRLRGLAPAPAPPLPGRHATGPFAFADTAEVRGLLADAGWAHVRAEEVAQEVRLDVTVLVDDEWLLVNGVPAERLGDAHDVVATHLKGFEVAPGVVEVPIAYAIVEATAP
jgi:SAM-dependent methyltransferase